MIQVILQVILGLGFLMFGYQKFTSEDMKEGFKYFGYSDEMRIFTGLFEIVAGVVILIGIWLKPLATIGSLMIVATMIGALFTHIKVKDEMKNMAMPFVLLLLGLVSTVLTWSHLFV